ncbi:MAG: fibronectin type III domain-containing protein [Capsulimonadaceae bacterium]
MNNTPKREADLSTVLQPFRSAQLRRRVLAGLRAGAGALVILAGIIAGIAAPAHAATDIDCGGAAAGAYLADTDYSGGGTDTWTNTINTTLLAAPVPSQTVLQSDREGTFTYTISGLAANSSQPVTLYFVEHYWSAVGDRVFNVTGNGNTLLSNFDIYGTTGADYKAVQENFNVTANSSGEIILVFTPVVDQASVCGIAVGTSGVPAAPTLSASSGTSGQIQLSWTASSGATTYNLYRGTATGAESSSPLSTGITATTYTDTGLTPGSSYFYEVSALNAAGTSAFSNQATATAGSAPTAPTLTSITGTGGAIELTWSNPYGATSYNIYRGTVAGGEAAAPVGSSTTSSYQDTGLVVAETYYYKVAAVDASGTSPLSNELSMAAGIPSPPALQTATGTGGVVALTWNSAFGATSYNVYRGTASGAEASTPVGLSSSTSYEDTGLVVGATYYYKIASVNSDGTSPLSNELSATAGTASSTISIDCGGAASTPFVADTDYSGGGIDTWTTTVNTTLLTGTIPSQTVLQSDREGAFTYTIPNLTAGSQHSFTLYFVEQYFSAAGERVFSVAANGTTVISNLDVYSTAGADYKAIQKTFTATANSGGQIVLIFTASVDQAKCGGIVVD